ncbi:NADPH-adrenodoxin reductase, partial [Coemansia erecta]
IVMSVPLLRGFASSSVATKEKHVAIVGGGAAGFYAAARLMAKTSDVTVDIFERLPAPHGLVRYGVAPDHPEVKNCMNKFNGVARNPRVRFFGNVAIGGGTGELSLETLRSLYDGVVLSYGASRDRQLGIAGEQGDGKHMGVVSARQFVAWYNGLPEAQSLEPDLESYDKIVIVGHGNVALDCARILLTDPEVLATTDITEQALNVLRRSKIRHVELVGRRGPLQVSFTTKELREMTKIPGLQIVTDVDLISSECKTDEGGEFVHRFQPLRRMMVLLLEHAVPEADLSASGKTFKLSFLKSPTEVLFDQKWGPSGTIVPQVLRLQKNKLEGLPETAKALPIDEFVDIPCAMVLRSIGYESTPMEDIPFDSKRKIVPNIAGRVIDHNEDVVPGLYVAGWLKRGPIGVIASTMRHSYGTADAMAIDLANTDHEPRCASRADIDAAFNNLGLLKSFVSNDDWRKLEAYEIEEGKKINKPREKVTSTKEMLHIIRKYTTLPPSL